MTTDGGPEARWAAGLDLFEASLARYEELLTDDEASTPPMWPPAELVGVAIPESQVERARRLVEQARALEGRLRARQQELGIGPGGGRIAGRGGGPTRRLTPSASFRTDL